MLSAAAVKASPFKHEGAGIFIFGSSSFVDLVLNIPGHFVEFRRELLEALRICASSHPWLRNAAKPASIRWSRMPARSTANEAIVFATVRKLAGLIARRFATISGSSLSSRVGIPNGDHVNPGGTGKARPSHGAALGGAVCSSGKSIDAAVAVCLRGGTA
jgi:hypothetical protein